MTSFGAWPSIETNGLLSVRAICEKVGLSEIETIRHLRTHRSESVPLGNFTLRDQKPLLLHNLLRNLEGSNLAIGDWLELLNSRVFFSTERSLVSRFRKSYCSKPVTIIVFCTATLIDRYRDRVELSSKNSGAARMPTHLKNRRVFESIDAFSYCPKSKPKEFTVQHSVPDLRGAIQDVIHLKANEMFLP